MKTHSNWEEEMKKKKKHNGNLVEIYMQHSNPLVLQHKALPRETIKKI